MDVLAGQELMFVEPAADAARLELVMQPTGKGLVGMAVADEAGIVLDGLDHGSLAGLFGEFQRIVAGILQMVNGFRGVLLAGGALGFGELADGQPGFLQDVLPLHDDLPQFGARIRVLTRDGRTLEREQLLLRGSIEDPMTWAELEHKFRANLRGKIADGAAALAVAAIAALDKQETMTSISEALLGPHPA